MRRTLVASFLIAALLGACANGPVAGRPADEPASSRRSTTADEALQVTGGLIKSVLSLFSVGIVVH